MDVTYRNKRHGRGMQTYADQNSLNIFLLITGSFMHIIIDFHEQLNFFLKRGFKGRGIEYPLTRRASVKDIIESFGVPHTETGCILFNNTPVDFYFIKNGSARSS